MNILTIIYFLVTCLGLGYTLLSLLKLKIEEKTERYVMMCGIGLGVFPILAILLNTVKIPLVWYLFLGFSLLIPFNNLLKFRFPKLHKPTFKVKYIFYIVLFVIFFAHLAVYLKGAFAYQYLENGDPWVHADVAQYVATEKTYSLPDNYQDMVEYTSVYHYIEPYPPGYAVLNGMLHQIDSDLKGVLKFFNALIISLGILFIYFFIYNLTQSRSHALFAAFLLAIVPCYLSHFIFAASLAVTLFFPAFYALTRIKDDKRWLYVAGIISASIIVTQPITAGIFGLFLGVYWLSGVIVYKNLQKYQLMAIILSGVLSAVYYIPTIMKFTLAKFAEKLGFFMFSVEHKVATSGGMIYTFKDYLLSPVANKIDQATGFGPFFLIALLLSVLFLLFIIIIVKFRDKERNRWAILSLVMFGLTFLATQSNRFEYTFFPHRVWVYMAIFAVILIVLAIPSLFNTYAKIKPWLWLILIIGLIATSALPKYQVQTSMWPPDYGLFQPVQGEMGVYSPELKAQLWMEDNLEWGSSVWIACWDNDAYAAGVNMQSLTMDRERRDYNLSEHTPEEVLEFAQRKDYDYIMFGVACLAKRGYPIETVQAILNYMVTVTNPVYSDQLGAFIFEVK